LKARGENDNHDTAITAPPLALSQWRKRMHIHGPAHVHGPQSIKPPHGPQSANPADQARPADSAPIRDEVEISDAARLIEQTQAMPEVRQDRVDAVRAQIARGTYETQEKLDIAVERLLDEIG